MFTLCAIFVPQKFVKDHNQEHPKEYTSVMKRFYHNDFMQRYTSEEDCKTAEEIKNSLETEKFNLIKFLSNKSVALEKILAQDKAELITQWILGQTWDPKTDKLMLAKQKILTDSDSF